MDHDRVRSAVLIEVGLTQAIAVFWLWSARIQSHCVVHATLGEMT
jgi:hypothetical protein